jgi:hypothetical protein
MTTPIERSIRHAKKALTYYLNGAAPESNVAVRDLLADVKHYCDANTVDFYAELDAAHRYYTEEVVEARQGRSGQHARLRKKKANAPVSSPNEKAKTGNDTRSRQKFLVISYDDDQRQWFYDFVVAGSEQAAVEKVCTRRDYVIAADALSVGNLDNLARSLDQETIEGIEEAERTDSNLEVR